MRSLLLLAIFASACGAQSTAPKFGELVKVPFKSAVRMPEDTTTVRFTDVTTDSRCPSGAQCIWAGDAAVVFTIGGTRQVTLHTNDGSATVIVGMSQLTLVALTPHPSVDKAIARTDYVATIRFDSAKD